MAHLPSGTVTLLFTDIEGSTRLLRQLGERYGDVLAEHQRLLREACAAHGGREVDTQGDAFFVAFARASDALAAAREAQAALEPTPVRVRIGVHTGEPVVTDEGHHLLDCELPPGGDVGELAAAVKATIGVVEHGLFLGMADEVLLGSPDGEVEVQTP